MEAVVIVCLVYEVVPSSVLIAVCFNSLLLGQSRNAIT